LIIHQTDLPLLSFKSMDVSNGGRLVYFLVFICLAKTKTKIETLTLNLQSEARQPADGPSARLLHL